MTRSGGKCYCLFEAQYFIRALNHWDYSEWVVLANSHQGIQEKKRTKQVLFHKMPKSSAQKKKLFPKVSLADTRTHKIMNQKKDGAQYYNAYNWRVLTAHPSHSAKRYIRTLHVNAQHTQISASASEKFQYCSKATTHPHIYTKQQKTNRKKNLNKKHKKQLNCSVHVVFIRSSFCRCFCCWCGDCRCLALLLYEPQRQYKVSKYLLTWIKSRIILTNCANTSSNKIHSTVGDDEAHLYCLRNAWMLVRCTMKCCCVCTASRLLCFAHVCVLRIWRYPQHKSCIVLHFDEHPTPYNSV